MANIPCDYCGNPASSIINEDNLKCMCAQCFSMTKTCAMCVEGGKCAFETDPSPLPKQVQKTIRQGNMVLQTVVKNPDRIRETCQFGCICFHEEFGCLKENGTCGNYKEVYL